MLDREILNNHFDATPSVGSKVHTKIIEKFQKLKEFSKVIISLFALFAGFILLFLSRLVGNESFTAILNAESCASCHTTPVF